MKKYLEKGWIKSEYIFYKSIINQWSAGFTKPMIGYEFLADSQRYLRKYITIGFYNVTFELDEIKCEYKQLYIILYTDIFQFSMGPEKCMTSWNDGCQHIDIGARGNRYPLNLPAELRTGYSA